MKCPLLMIHVIKEPGRVDLQKIECGKEECAWWDSEIKRCSAINVSLELTAIAETLDRLEKKMPPARR